MLKVIYIILLFSKAFAALYSVDDKAGGLQNDQAQNNKSNLTPVEITADDHNLYHVDLYRGEQDGEVVPKLEDNKTKVEPPLEDLEIIVEEVVEVQPIAGFVMVMEDPEFVINGEAATPAVPDPTTEDSLNATAFVANITTNETKPEKSFLEEVEEGLGISTGGSSQLFMGIFSFTMLISILINLSLY